MKYLLMLTLLIFAGDAIKLEKQWIRSAPAGTNSAFFVDIVNNSDQPDTLYKAESDLAQVVEVHETYHTENGMMGMRHVDSIEIPANGTLQLKPGSYHIMLIRLNEDLKQGDTGKVTLFFKNGGKVAVEASVKDMKKGHMMMKKDKTPEKCCGE